MSHCQCPDRLDSRGLQSKNKDSDCQEENNHAAHKRYLVCAAFVLAAPTGVIAGNCGGHAMHDDASEPIVRAQYQGTSAPGMSDPRLSGARLLGNYCGRCHGLPDPGQHSAQAWSQVVARMYGHMREFARDGDAIETPNAQELSMIIAYLQNNADTD